MGVYLSKNVVEICANCGKVNKEKVDDFKCTNCGSDVCVVVPITMFKSMVDAGVARE